MKKFGKFLRERAMEIINFKKGKMKLSTNEQQKSYENENIYYISEKKIEDKLGTIAIIQANIEVLHNLQFSVPKKV